MNKKLSISIVLAAIVLLSGFVLFDGTGDSGDSILHFLYAQSAPNHPALYFDHWAKPVYVLFASPFAHFGFAGVKLMNVILGVISFYFTVKTTHQLQLKNALLSGLFLLLAPLFFILTYSGLTEPLFACVLITSIAFFTKDKLIFAAILISFLPFVRSEGLFYVALAALFLVLKKNWKLLPLLGIGHLVYSLAGWFVYGNLLWVFKKIPYARLSTNYGEGTLSHFAEQLIYVVGVPIYMLFWLGLVVMFWKLIRKKSSTATITFVFLGFLVFFCAHTLFWYLGIFNSMGLKRVFVGIMPLMAIIALTGFNFLTEEVFSKRKIIRISLQIALIGYCFIFPFTKNPAAIHWKKDLYLTNEQQLIQLIASDIRVKFQNPGKLVYLHPYFSLALNLDHFDSKIHENLTSSYAERIKKGDLIIWDNWFAVVEAGITKEKLELDQSLKKIYAKKTIVDKREIEFVVFEKKGD